MKGIGIITLNATRFNPNWERKYYQSISLTKHVTVAYHDCDTIFPNPDLYGIEDARLERCTLRPARYILIRHFCFHLGATRKDFGIDLYIPRTGVAPNVLGIRPSGKL